MLPDLATELPTTENGGISEDGTVYTFHLKKGIKFAPPVDREVTSADFKYSFERMMADPKAPATGFYTGVVGAQAFMDGKAKEIKGYQTPDKYTVVIRLSHPDMAFMGAMAMSFTDVVAREWVQKWGRQINRHPLGTGPFVFDHWTSGQEIVVKRNPNYYAPDYVYLDGIDFEFSLNPSTALLKLERGDVNVLGDYIPPADYVRVTSNPQLKQLVVEEPVIAIDYLFLNRTVKPFDNVKVRQAISMAVDRSRIIKLLSGAAAPLTQLYPAGLPGHQDGAAGEFYAYDPAKAKQLLAEAGFPERLPHDALLPQRRPVAQGAAVDPAGPQGHRRHGGPQGPGPRHVLDAHRQGRQVRRGAQRLVDGLPRPQRLHHPALQQEHGDRRGHQPELLVEPQDRDDDRARRRRTQTRRRASSSSSRSRRRSWPTRRACRCTSPR